MTSEKKSMQQKLASGEPIVGTFLLSHDPHTLNIAANAGIDVVFLDFEHGTYSIELASRFIDLARLTQSSIFIRCTMDQVLDLSRLFDHGLNGVLVAGARTKADIQAVIQKVKFPPQGKRGFNPIVPAAGYGRKLSSEFRDTSNLETDVWVLVENRQLVSQIDELTKTEGLSGVFFGPYDLSVDLGHPGEVNHPLVEGTLQQGIHQVQAAGLPTGIFTAEASAAKPWMALGVQLLVVGADWLNLQTTWSNSVRQISG